MPSELTLLNLMADKDFDRSVAVHNEWGLRWMDLKDHIYGKSVEHLDDAGAARARERIDAHGLQVYCLSTTLMNDHVERGEAHFREHYLDRIAAMKPVVDRLRPKFFRLLGAEFDGRRADESVPKTLMREHPWVIPLYQEAVDRVLDLGVPVTIENEWRNCILTTPDDVNDFFGALDRPQAGFTWDVQNQWTSGVFPNVEDYRRMKRHVHYVHFKGGQYEDPATRALAWRTGLEEASWPVREIVSEVLADGNSPVICLNPSHGQPKASYDYDYATVAKRDIDFLRGSFEGIA